MTKIWNRLLLKIKGLKNKQKRKDNFKHFPEYVKKHIKQDEDSDIKYKKAILLSKLLDPKIQQNIKVESDQRQRVLHERQAGLVQRQRVLHERQAVLVQRQRVLQERQNNVGQRQRVLQERQDLSSSLSKTAAGGSRNFSQRQSLKKQLFFIWNTSNLNAYLPALENIFRLVDDKINVKNHFLNFSAYDLKTPGIVPFDLNEKQFPPEEKKTRILFYITFVPSTRTSYKIYTHAISELKKYFDKIIVIILKVGHNPQIPKKEEVAGEVGGIINAEDIFFVNIIDCTNFHIVKDQTNNREISSLRQIFTKLKSSS